VLMAQLNRAATNHLNALIMRWLAWIRLFDFKVRHVPEKQHIVADALSRRLRHPKDTRSSKEGEDIND
jgi:hypothetical protein